MRRLLRAPDHQWIRLSAAAGRGLVTRVRRAWQSHHFRHHARIPLAVLVTDRSRRRTVERNLRKGLRELHRVLGPTFPHDIVIVVQQVITTDHQLAGCYQLARRPDRSQLKLVRLALEVDGHQLTPDELLAVLAEQCVGLASLDCGTPSVLVPVELEPLATRQDRRHTLRPDPLAPGTNRTTEFTGEQVA